MGFWSPELWLPRDVDWHQLPPKFEDLVYPIYLGVPFVIIRILYESLVGIPLAHYFGYKKNSSLAGDVIQYISGGFFKNTRQKRVLECFWRWSYYTFAFVFGVYALWDKSWLWDIKQCWIGYPFHKVDDIVWWYYTFEAAFYYSLLLSSFFEVRRSDFWQLIVHHVVTVGLLAFSWTINFVRVGTLVLLSHDIADVVLEAGKLVRYDHRWKFLTNIMFVLFLLSWIVTRLGYYPFVLIRSGLQDAAGLIQPDYDLWDFSVIPYAPRAIIMLLVILLALHVFWTFLIVRVVIRTLTQGEAKDVRSDSDTDSEEDSTKGRKKLLVKAKKTSQQSEEESEDERPNHTNARRRKVRRD